MKSSRCRPWHLLVIWLPFAAWSLRAWWDSTHARAWEAGDPDVYVWGVGCVGAICALCTALLATLGPDVPGAGRETRLLIRAEVFLRQGRLNEAADAPAGDARFRPADVL